MTEPSSRGFHGIEDPTDEFLDRVAGGDEEAFHELYVKYRRLVFAIARSVLGDTALAEDACQDTFIRVHRSLNTFRRGTRFGVWICTIARNASINATRGGRQKEVPMPEEVAAPPQAERGGIEDMLRSLSSEERVVVLMRYVQGLSYEEMAVALNRAQGTLRNVMSRALGRLRQCLTLDAEERQ